MGTMRERQPGVWQLRISAGFDPIDHTQVDARLGDWGDVKALTEHVDVMADVIVKFDATPSNASMAVRRVCLTGEVEFTTRVIRASQPHPREGSA